MTWGYAWKTCGHAAMTTAGPANGAGGEGEKQNFLKFVNFESITTPMLKRALQLLLLTGLGFSGVCQELDWVFTENYISTQFYQEIQSDNNGNVYVIGDITTDIDVIFGNDTLPHKPFDDGERMILLKLDSTGNVLWARQFGSVQHNEWPQSLAIDSLGYIYVLGRASVDTNGFIYPNDTMGYDTLFFPAGYHSIFIMKFDSMGNVLRVNSVTCTDLAQDGGIGVSDIGEFYLAHNTEDSLLLENDTLPGGIYSHIAVLKFDSAGNYEWGFNLENQQDTSISWLYDFTTDRMGNSYIFGTIDGPMDFDPDTGTYIIDYHGSFLAKYNPDKQLMWLDTFTVFGRENYQGITTDHNGNVYFTGRYSSGNNKNSIGNYTLPGNGGGFIAKYNPAGSLVFCIPQKGDNVQGYGITVDSMQNIYSTGRFFHNSLADFDPGPKKMHLESFSLYDIFISKYDSIGIYQWAFKIGHLSNDEGYGLSYDHATQSIFALGAVTGWGDFDPSPDTLLSTGHYVAKYNPSCLMPNAPNIVNNDTSLCTTDSVTLSVSSNNYSIATSITWHINECGKDSIGEGNSITVKPDSTTTYYTRYEGGCIDSGACDTVTININPILSDNSIITECLCNNDSTGVIDYIPTGGSQPYSYLWNTGDTVQDLVNIPEGTYYVTLTDSMGCSITNSFYVGEPSQLDISINSLDTLITVPNTGYIDISTSGGTPLYTYNWSNGATTEDVSNLGTGSISVTITDANNCQLIRSWQVTLVQGNDDKIDGNKNVVIYPLPFNEQLYINITDKGTNSKFPLLIHNVVGEEVYSDNIPSQATLDLSFLSQGVYFLSLTLKENNGFEIVKRRIVKN